MLVCFPAPFSTTSGKNTDGLKGSGCIAALEAEKYLAESEGPEAEKPSAEVERSVVEPAVQEVGGQAKKDAKGAVGEYKSNPLL